MFENGKTKEDIKLPSDLTELSKKIRTDFDKGKELLVTIIKSNEEEKIISYREVNY